jgi:oligosaccharide repeat unit polymerase
MSNLQVDSITPEDNVAAPVFAPHAPIILHPLVIYSVVWIGVVCLYSLHFSYILRYPTSDAIKVVLKIWLPFAATVCIYSLLHIFSNGISTKRRVPWNLDLDVLRRRLRFCFKVWALMSMFEVIVSGGVPLLWALTGSSKSYTDFGIPSLNGLINSLILSISISYFLLFIVTKNRRDVAIPILVLCWSVVIINRNMMLVTLIEFAVIYVRIRKIRFATFVRLGSGILAFVLAFGVIGDIRQGASGMIRDLAQPTDDYPMWLPSGVLWAYIYITTPVNNLIYNMEEIPPENNALFPSTVATLFPSVIRVVIYGNEVGDAESGQLVVSAFNVSTAYVGPYSDYGIVGITLFSIMIACICQFFWFRESLRGILMFAVVTQCLAITLFFDHFFYLPVITQLGWLWLFFSPRAASLCLPRAWKKRRHLLLSNVS